MKNYCHDTIRNRGIHFAIGQLRREKNGLLLTLDIEGGNRDDLIRERNLNVLNKVVRLDQNIEKLTNSLGVRYAE